MSAFTQADGRLDWRRVIAAVVVLLIIVAVLGTIGLHTTSGGGTFTRH